MTQKDKIISYLQTHDYITALDAMNYFGIMRLAARVKELEDKGYVFKKKMIKGHNRYGDDTRYIGYGLEVKEANGHFNEN